MHLPEKRKGWGLSRVGRRSVNGPQLKKGWKGKKRKKPLLTWDTRRKIDLKSGIRGKKKKGGQ